MNPYHRGITYICVTCSASPRGVWHQYSHRLPHREMEYNVRETKLKSQEWGENKKYHIGMAVGTWKYLATSAGCPSSDQFDPFILRASLVTKFPKSSWNNFQCQALISGRTDVAIRPSVGRLFLDYNKKCPNKKQRWNPESLLDRPAPCSFPWAPMLCYNRFFSWKHCSPLFCFFFLSNIQL